jgi:hypothetical protein
MMGGHSEVGKGDMGLCLREKDEILTEKRLYFSAECVSLFEKSGEVVPQVNQG